MELPRNYFWPSFTLGISALIIPLKASAFCPLCVIATGFLTGYFRWLGVDDLIIGLWLGGFLVSSSILINSIVARKNINLPKTLIPGLIYVLSFLALYFGGILSIPYGQLFGFPRIILGIIIGSIVILATPKISGLIKNLNGGRNFFSHQKMLVAIFLLLILSLIFYLLIK